MTHFTSTQAYTPDLDGLIAWLETQPSDRTYNFIEYRYCAAGLFVSEGLGREPQPFEVERLIFGATRPFDFDKVAAGKLNYFGCGFEEKGERTLGAALERAKHIRDESPEYLEYLANDWNKR